MRTYNDKSKILKEVVSELRRLPNLPEDYDQLTMLATFLHSFRELLANDPQMQGAMEVGIEVSEIIFRALKEKLVRNTFMWQQLHPLMENGRWRKYFHSLSTLSKYLGRECIKRDTLEAAGEKYHDLRHRNGETATAWGVRLVNQYHTAAMCAEFLRSNPFHAIVQLYVQHTELPLRSMLIEALKTTKVKWKARDLRERDLTGPKAVQHILQRVCRELERQVEMWDVIHKPRRLSPWNPSENKSSYNNRRSQSPRRIYQNDNRQSRERQDLLRTKHPNAAFANVTQETVDAGTENSELNTVAHNTTTNSRSPVGSIGPERSPNSQGDRNVRFNNTTRPPPSGSLRTGDRARTQWAAKKSINGEERERHVPGSSIYTGCFNCKSLEHLARNCDKPLSNHLLMLAENPYNLTSEQSHILLMQGNHPSIENIPENEFALDDWAAVYVLNSKMENEDQYSSQSDSA
jgi:hypothetical protein